MEVVIATLIAVAAVVYVLLPLRDGRYTGRASRTITAPISDRCAIMYTVRRTTWGSAPRSRSRTAGRASRSPIARPASAKVSSTMVPTTRSEHEVADLQQTFVTTHDRQRQRQQRQRAHPELGPEQVAHGDRARAQQPQRAPLERHAGEDEARRDRRQHEAGERQVQEGHHVDEEEGDALAAQRQELDVEHVHHHQHRQQDQLRPLRGVAEEDRSSLSTSSRRSDAQGRQQPARTAKRRPGPPRARCCALSCALLKPRRTSPVQQRAQHQRAPPWSRAGRAEPVGSPRGSQHRRLLHPLARQEAARSACAGRPRTPRASGSPPGAPAAPAAPGGTAARCRPPRAPQSRSGCRACAAPEQTFTSNSVTRCPPPPGSCRNGRKPPSAKRKEPAPLVHHAVRREHRDGEQHATIQLECSMSSRAAWRRTAAASPPARRPACRGPRQEEARQRRDHVRQQQDREERQQHQPQQLAGQQRARSPPRRGSSAAAGTARRRSPPRTAAPPTKPACERAPRPFSRGRARAAVSHLGPAAATAAGGGQRGGGAGGQRIGAGGLRHPAPPSGRAPRSRRSAAGRSPRALAGPRLRRSSSIVPQP
jgi:hypothetical protein